NGRYIVPKAPSICLGATDLSVMEMTGAYTTFANNGIYNKPRFITKIEDRNGRLLYEEEPEERQAIEERPNYVMVEMLRYASGGMGLESQVGGKTGTTNDYVDGWFMGITPSLVVGTWVGGEDRWIRFLDLLYGQGAYMAKPYFKKVMQRLEKDEEADYDKTARFHIPPGDLGIEMDCSKYEHGLPSEGGDTFNEYDGFAEDVFGDEELLPRRDSSFQRDRFEEQ
ncbi:MAG: peptidoglycan glycosyltransferase, partial [Saprospiraceae bacterium]|nr:peptidoglycan glycosyltransferase [Saprospiraceae bacterium]